LTRVFALTVFLSAFLLFQSQLIIAKYLLPWFGGTPAVWTTCMVFFQVMLLAGYGYAHLLSQKLASRIQTIAHLSLLAGCLALLVALARRWPAPILPGPDWNPAGTPKRTDWVDSGDDAMNRGELTPSLAPHL
jgi:hypothetical protein